MIIVTVDLWLAKFLTYTKLFKKILLVVVVGSTGYVVGLTSFFGIFFTKAFENFHNKNWWEVWSRDASSSPTFLLGLAITFKSIELELNTMLQFQILCQLFLFFRGSTYLQRILIFHQSNNYLTKIAFLSKLVGAQDFLMIMSGGMNM